MSSSWYPHSHPCLGCNRIWLQNSKKYCKQCGCRHCGYGYTKWECRERFTCRCGRKIPGSGYCVGKYRKKCYYCLGDKAPAYDRCRVCYLNVYKDINCIRCHSRMIIHDHSRPFCYMCGVDIIQALGKNNALYLGIMPRDILNIICRYLID